jgi:hypothetical protein
MNDLMAKAKGPLKGVPGVNNILYIQDSFEITSRVGTHQCLAFEPLGLDLLEWKHRMEGGYLQEYQLHIIVTQLLYGVNWLFKAGYIHGGEYRYPTLPETVLAYIFNRHQSWECLTSSG